MAQEISSMGGVIEYDDGTVFDSNTQTLYPTIGAFLADDTSLASTTSAPTINPSSVPNQATSDLSGLFSSMGNFGVSMASIFSGKPVVATASGRIIGAQGSVVAAPQTGLTLGTMLLIGLGIFLVVKLAH